MRYLILALILTGCASPYCQVQKQFETANHVLPASKGYTAKDRAVLAMSKLGYYCGQEITEYKETPEGVGFKADGQPLFFNESEVAEKNLCDIFNLGSDLNYRLTEAEGYQCMSRARVASNVLNRCPNIRYAYPHYSKKVGVPYAHAGVKVIDDKGKIHWMFE